MKAKKIVRYRIPVSIVFPATHPRAGEPTDFRMLIHTCCKIHTIRANYDLWAKRFEKINRGEAVLELYYWTGKPYNSKTETICQLGKDDGIGMQKIRIFSDFPDSFMNGRPINNELIARNDGLSFDDFQNWFKGYNLSEPMAIIHFTNFRY